MRFKIFHENSPFKLIVIALLLLVFLSGCQISFLNLFGGGKTRVRSTPEGLYSGGAYEFSKKNYTNAREYFTRLKDEYPLHELAVMARIGVADSYFSQKKYAEAENEYSDFIVFHPTNENVPYAIYQVGMCHYNQIGSIDRDQSSTIMAKREFEKLVSRYPESKFSIMAEEKIRDCKQKLAEHEFYVGQFYFKQKKYQAALARFETIEREYANIGFDYKAQYFINETKEKIAEEERLNKEKLEKINKKNQEKSKSAKM
jgi:outer membrane protein assembly factor BamD